MRLTEILDRWKDRIFSQIVFKNKQFSSNQTKSICKFSSLILVFIFSIQLHETDTNSSSYFNSGTTIL